MRTCQILLVLRNQAARIGPRGFSRDEAPELYDLAQLARASDGPSCVFRGIRFPLRCGLWKYVVDPLSREFLVATDGGLFE
jgi:hypothetical protein